MESEPDQPAATDATAIQQETTMTTLPLYKAYFDDPTLADLTIKLSDRSFHAHRIVLCRASKYFANLLTGRFRESNAREIELHDDDPEAMTALLRYLYGLQYAPDLAEWHDGKSLVPHALVYTTAEKYQIKGLQVDVCKTMENIFRANSDMFGDGFDLLSALRIIFAGTPLNDGGARELLIWYCVARLRILAENKNFMKLVAEVPELGATLIGYHFGGAHSDKDYNQVNEKKMEEDYYCEHCEENTTLVTICKECAN